MGPCIRFLSFSAQVPMSSMAMKTSVCSKRGFPGELCLLAQPPEALLPGKGQGVREEETLQGAGAGGTWHGWGLTLVINVPKHCTM